MPRIERPAQHEWTCGHIAGSMCAECYHLLAATAHKLAEENLELRGASDALALALSTRRRIAEALIEAMASYTHARRLAGVEPDGAALERWARAAQIVVEEQTHEPRTDGRGSHESNA